MIGRVSDPDWLTWPQAAGLVGCPVSTIETYVRTGRIEKRPVRGPFPSLRRESVEAFATWWAQEIERRERIHAIRDQRKAATERRRIRPPESEGWIRASEAAEQLGFAHSDHIVYLVRQGYLDGRKVGIRWWVRAESLEAYSVERARWVSHQRAAAIVGCSTETIRRAVNDGRIEKRDVHRTQPSLSIESVQSFAEQWDSRGPRRRPADRDTQEPNSHLSTIPATQPPRATP